MYTVMLSSGEATVPVYFFKPFKHDEIIYTGLEMSGFIYVESGKGGGWVKNLVVTVT